MSVKETTRELKFFVHMSTLGMRVSCPKQQMCTVPEMYGVVAQLVNTLKNAGMTREEQINNFTMILDKTENYKNN